MVHGKRIASKERHGQRRENEKWFNLRAIAHERLWLKIAHRVKDLAELREGSANRTFVASRLDVKKNFKRVLKDQCQQFACLKAAVADESTCIPVLGKDVVLVMDKI